MLRTSLVTFGESYQIIQNFLEETKHAHIIDGELEFNGLRDRVCFDSVDFYYDGNEQPTLKKVSLEIPKGKVTAIVGESGSGKSTLIDLLLRFYDSQHGCITIDGTEVKLFNLKSLRKRISVVSQDNFLFNTTVFENIRYGNPEASRSQVLMAARQAHAEDFINDFPDGFSSILGDRGVRLSGGQKQRLAIARAIVRDPDILILDEATSALDSTSEKMVQKALDEVSKNRTVIVIAHRLSTIHHADQIVVMKHGEVLATGTHSELMRTSGYYNRLNRDQMIAV